MDIVYAEPARVWQQHLQLPVGSCVQHALTAMDPLLFPEHLQVSADFLAIYGRSVRPEERLQAYDRIELLRPLIRDPKDTRRLRAITHPLKKTRC